MGKKTNIALAIAAASAAVWAGTKAIAKPQVRTNNMALQFERTVILGKHGAGQLAPAHSMISFEIADQLGVDGFKVDVRLTKDEQIVLFHDDSLEKSTNFIGNIKDYTLDELKEFNIGEKFQDENGENPFKDEHLQIVSLRELLEAFSNKYILIDIKDHPDTYEGSLMPSKLWRLMEELEVSDKIIVSSNYAEQIDRFDLYAQSRVVLSAGENEATKAFTAFTSQFGHLYKPKADILTVPTKLNVINFESPRFLQFLANLNCSIFYTDVNDVESFQRLINSNAKGIITERPDLLIKNS